MSNKIVGLIFYISKLEQRSFIQPPITTENQLKRLFEKANKLQERGEYEIVF